MTDFVWSIDDAGMGNAALVDATRRMARFFESRSLAATWLVVPKPSGQPLSPEWLDVLREARDRGHDLQLHGLSHADCFEFGPPAWPATSIRPAFVDEFAQRREELLPRYTVANLRARMEEGLEIFRRELGIDPVLFRAPCGAISQAMFTALAQVGIGYHSCQYISGTGYQHLPHNSGDLTPVWTDEIPHRPYRWYADVIEAPILNEYTWRGAGARSQDFIDLARQDASRIVQESPVAVILMHTHGIADDFDHACRLVDGVMEHVASLGDHAFTTLDALIRSGKLAAAATVVGPDNLM
jgi:peptidoglycan/xylan/chitin deacetylase (PgdA/CDA1 family)